MVYYDASSSGEDLGLNRSPDIAQLRFLQLRKIGRKAMTKQTTLSVSAHAGLGQCAYPSSFRS